jgi:N-acetylmuramoyl-L-alanine amidase
MIGVMQTPQGTPPAIPPAAAPETKAKSARGKDAPAQPRQGLVFQLALVVGVALVLATLFTAWTPGGPSDELPTPVATGIAVALQPSPTFPPGQPTPTLRNPRLVGLVAGHWKNDSGSVCPDGLKEVDVNLQIATLAQKILIDAGYEVELLHEFDPKLTDYQAAALVSIHNDSCDFINNEATGFKVAQAMATRHPERTARLTSCLRARYGASTGLPLHSTSVTPDMTSYHAFGEINENTPATIIETGFLNLDRQILTEQPERVAQGVAEGILCYLRNEPIVGPTVVAPTVSPPTPAPTP